MSTLSQQPDLAITNMAASQFNMNNGANAQGGYSNENLLLDTLNDVFGSIDMSLLAYIVDLEGVVQTFNNDTNKQIVLNDLSNNNMYIAESLKKENEKFDNIGEKTTNNIHKTRAKFMEKKWAIGFNNFFATIFKFLFLLTICFFIAFSFVRKDKINKTLFYIVVSIVAILAAFVILLYFKSNQTKRRDDWNKWYFSSLNTQSSNNRNGNESCMAES